ncbi:hypothetical protein [Nocardioides guangzhouensis]|nr:hypothetical protein [Nocardioides guangzhouensis]
MTQHKDSVREILTALTTPPKHADGPDVVGEPAEIAPVRDTDAD